MMMRMLAAGGLELLTDDARAPDGHNPRGYFEYRPVKAIEKDASWMAGAVGKAVKIVSPLLVHLPSSYRYRIIVMRRDLREVLTSQQAMLDAHGVDAGDAGDADAMRLAFERLRVRVEAWLAAAPNVAAIDIMYAETIAAPRAMAERVAAFIERGLDVGAMAAAVDAGLYRCRAATHAW